MAQRKQSTGPCGFCGREMTKGGLSRHLKSCPQRLEAIEAADGQKQAGPTEPLYHFQVQAA
jgi:hypothetical protein